MLVQHINFGGKYFKLLALKVHLFVKVHVTYQLLFLVYFYICYADDDCDDLTRQDEEYLEQCFEKFQDFFPKYVCCF